MMAQPSLQGFNPDKIPQALKDLSRWAPWRAVWSDKRKKYDKVPCHMLPPFYGISTARPEKWYTFEVAAKALRENPTEFAGLGFVMTGVQSVLGIDLDRCVTDNRIDPWAQEIINQVASYTELSPSGKGIRIFAQGSTDRDWTNHEVGIEVYSGHEPRFLTITGQRLRSSVEEMTWPELEVIDSITTQYRKAKENSNVISLDMPELLEDFMLPDLSGLSLSTAVEAFLNTGECSGDRSHMLFRAAIGLYNNGLSDDVVFSMLVGNAYAYEVALDHRRQDHDRALMYIWVEHCQKGKAKSTPVSGLGDFEDLGIEETNAPEAHVESSPPAIKTVADDYNDFDVVTDEVVATPPKKMRFAAVSAAVFAGGPPPAWIVKGLVPRAELVVLFGASRSGKSFIALDIAACIARGVAWRGLKVKQGRVVYIAAEGGGGFRNRLKAYAIANKIDLDSIPLDIIHAAPNLMVKDDAMDLCKAIIACGKVSLVIVDTFAQTMPGANENAGEDVSKALQHCKGIHKATNGATVLLIHHSGKDSSKGARGWSGLQAAADAEFEVQNEDGVREIRVTKQKDGDDSGRWGFRLAPVDVGVDEDGDKVVSCICVESEVIERKRGGPRPFAKGWGRRVLEVLGEMALVQTSGIERDVVASEVIEEPPEGTVATGRRELLRLANKALTAVLEHDEMPYVWDDETKTISVNV